MYSNGSINVKPCPAQVIIKHLKTTGYDYFDARGYFTFNVTKYIDVAFGYDKNFIGNGYRSLFLSDFGNSNLVPETKYQDLEDQLPEPIYGIECNTEPRAGSIAQKEICSHASS